MTTDFAKSEFHEVKLVIAFKEINNLDILTKDVKSVSSDLHKRYQTLCSATESPSEITPHGSTTQLLKTMSQY